jgi:hypothetical protein
LLQKQATGNAIGGLSVGEPERGLMYAVCKLVLRSFTTG